MTWLKRAIDVAVAAPALMVATPVIAAACAVVRATSRGPAFYVQERAGRDKKPIRVFKIRTMHQGADRVGGHVTAGRDPRVTGAGRFLRRYKLDELPQLFNVLRGDMSIVGPRPEALRYVRQFPPEWNELFASRPGITDLASLAFRNEEAILEGCSDPERAYVEGILPEKIPLAIEGVRRSSLAFDLGILVKTLRALALDREGGDHPAVLGAKERIARYETPRVHSVEELR